MQFKRGHMNVHEMLKIEINNTLIMYGEIDLDSGAHRQMINNSSRLLY